VQLAGARLWRVWSYHCLPTDYRRSLIGDPAHENVAVPSRPVVAPLFEGRLDAGDILYIPALCGHEGVTLEESVSLSVAWRGISVFGALSEAFPDQRDLLVAQVLDLGSELFQLLEDPSAGARAVQTRLEAQLVPVAEQIFGSGSRSGVIDWIATLSAYGSSWNRVGDFEGS
jgi:ribosomal protein L16 Arg81 hydroxylase